MKSVAFKRIPIGELFSVEGNLFRKLDDISAWEIDWCVERQFNPEFPVTWEKNKRRTTMLKNRQSLKKRH